MVFIVKDKKIKYKCLLFFLTIACIANAGKTTVTKKFDVIDYKTSFKKAEDNPCLKTIISCQNKNTKRAKNQLLFLLKQIEKMFFDIIKKILFKILYS